MNTINDVLNSFKPRIEENQRTQLEEWHVICDEFKKMKGDYREE